MDLGFWDVVAAVFVGNALTILVTRFGEAPESPAKDFVVKAVFFVGLLSLFIYYVHPEMPAEFLDWLLNS